MATTILLTKKKTGRQITLWLTGSNGGYGINSISRNPNAKPNAKPSPHPASHQLQLFRLQSDDDNKISTAMGVRVCGCPFRAFLLPPSSIFICAPAPLPLSLPTKCHTHILLPATALG